MNPSRPAISAKIEALDPARFQALVEEYVPIQFPGRFQNLQRRGSNITGETIAGWPDAYATMPDNRLDVLEVTHTDAWRSHLREDSEKASATRFAGRIGGFVFVAWARTPEPTVSLEFRNMLMTLGIPSERIAFVFREQLVSDLCQAKFALLWEQYLGLAAHCLPFHPIERAKIYGSAHQTNIFTPTREEYTKGLVHRPNLTGQVEQLLRARGVALVRGKGASGKTVMAAQIALGQEFRTAPVYYLNLADLVSANEADSSRALDVITWRKDQGVLFIVDNIHLHEQMAREILDYWQGAPAGSYLFLLGRWTESGPNPQGVAAPLGDIDQEALKLEVNAADLLGVLHRLAARSGLAGQIGVPPAEVVGRWLALFGGDLIAFSAATALRIGRMAMREWELTADNAKEYVRSTYLYPFDRPLTGDELHNLLLIATLSKLELATPYAAIRRGDIRKSLRAGLVHRIDPGGEKAARFHLVHPGFGELLTSAADPPLEEKTIYQEVALAVPSDATRIALRLEKLGQRDSALAVIRLLTEDHRRLVAALLSNSSCGWTPFASDLMQRLGGHSFKDTDEALCHDAGFLTTAAVNTSLPELAKFLQYSQQKLPKSYAGVVAGLGQPKNQAKLIETALQTPLELVASFLRHARGNKELELAHDAIAAGLGDPNNLTKLMEVALRMPLNRLASFLGYAARNLPKVYSGMAAALAEPSNLAKLSETAPRSTLDNLVPFLGYSIANLPKVYNAIAAALAEPSNLAKLSETALRSGLGSLTAFFRFSLGTQELQGVPAKVLLGIDLPTWDRIRLHNPQDQAHYMHAAALLFQELGRPELMQAPAEAAILRPDASLWHVHTIGLHHLAHTLRLGHIVDEDAVQRFLRIVVTEPWLKEQYESSNAGTIAACLFSVWAYHGERVMPYFLTGTLGRRLATELGRLRHLGDRELGGAISLYGCCSLIVKTLPVSPKWPTPEDIQEMLNFFEPHANVNQLGTATVIRWLGLREVARLMPEEIQVPHDLGEPVLAMWRNAEPKIERHQRLNLVMIPWLERCSKSGWHLLREQHSLFEELACETTSRPVDTSAG